MLRTIFLLIITSFLWLSPLFAQEGTSSSIPIDPANGKISYSNVVNVDGLAKDKLYEKALAWANDYYNNPANVIREKDSANGKIVCKSRYRLNNPPDKKGIVTSAGDAMYTLTIELKDDRFRYTIEEINWMKTSAFPGEKWLDEKSQSYLPVYKDYLAQTDAEIREVAASLESFMTTKKSDEKDNW